MKIASLFLLGFVLPCALLAQDAAPKVDSFVQPTAEQVEKAVVGNLGPHVVNFINQAPGKIVNANYPGGEKKMVATINANLKYPPKCEAAKKEGIATVSFFVEADGTCTNYKVESEPCDGMGNEVIRVLKLLNKWNPATVDGVKTRQQYRFPVNFRLNPNAGKAPAAPPRQLSEAEKKRLQAEFDKLPLEQKKKIIAQQQAALQQAAQQQRKK